MMHLQQDLSLDLKRCCGSRRQSSRARKACIYCAQTARFILIGWYRRKGNQQNNFVEADHLHTPHDPSMRQPFASSASRCRNDVEQTQHSA